MLTTNGITHRRWCCLLANLNSFAYDYIARQKVGGLRLNFLLYGFTRDEINDVLNGFNGVVKEDEAHGGPGQTRSAILAAFATFGR